MVICYSNNLKPDYWDCNIDLWLPVFLPEGASASIWIVPGTIAPEDFD